VPEFALIINIRREHVIDKMSNANFAYLASLNRTLNKEKKYNPLQICVIIKPSIPKRKKRAPSNDNNKSPAKDPTKAMMGNRNVLLLLFPEK
jgi:hypothetical protein